MCRRLPASPSLRYLRTEAKDRHRGYRGGDAEALVRVRESHPQYAHASDDALPSAGLPLSEAQFTLAREYGFGCARDGVSEGLRRSECVRSGLTGDAAPTTVVVAARPLAGG